MSRSGRLVALAVVCATALCGCGSKTAATTSGEIPSFTLVPGATRPCVVMMRQLPPILDGQRRLPWTGSRYGAAWGNPALTLRCGVPQPAEFTAELKARLGPPCLTVNGIDWYLKGEAPPSAANVSGAPPIVVTTVFRTPAIELTVPASYGTQGPSAAMALLTSLVRANTKVSGHCL